MFTESTSKQEVIGPFLNYTKAKQYLDEYNTKHREIMDRKIQEALKNGQACSFSQEASILTEGGKIYVVHGKVISDKIKKDPVNINSQISNTVESLSPPSTALCQRRRSNSEIPNSYDKKVGGRSVEFTESTTEATTYAKFTEPSVVVHQNGGFTANEGEFEGEVKINPVPLRKKVCKKIYSTICSICPFIYRVFNWLAMQFKKVFC